MFRLRRANRGMGAFLGLVAGIALGAVFPELGPFVLVTPFLGWWAGGAVGHDVCSEPTCRAELPQGAKRCRACDGRVRGAVTRASDHWVKRAAWLRGEG